MKHFINLGEFSARAKGYYTICRIKWIPSLTWVWSGFTFNEMVFLSGDNFGFVLDEIGDFQICFVHRRQRPVYHPCVSGPRWQGISQWGGEVGGEVTELCRTPGWGVWRWWLCAQHGSVGFPEVDSWSAQFCHLYIQHHREVREVCWC